MRIESVVLNASPLITLFRSGQAGLLPRLFPHIVVPNAVWREVVMDEKEDLAARELSLQPWPTRVDVVSSPRVEASAADNNPELGRQYLRDTFGQGYWARRETMIGLLEWLAKLANTSDMGEWAKDSEAAMILAGRLRTDHA